MSQYSEVSMSDEQHTASSLPTISVEFKNELLYLLVEGTVFVVNRQTFIDDSEFFKEMYELPSTRDRPVDGSSFSHPLLVEGVNKSDIVLLLRAMFPRYIGATDDITCDEWISVLNLLILWRFDLGRDFVLKKLQLLTDPVTKILLYDLHGLDPEIWLVPSVNALAQRTEPLSEAEGERLGITNTVRIYQVRETFPAKGFRTKRTARGEVFNVAIVRGEYDFIPKVRSTYGLAQT